MMKTAVKNMTLIALCIALVTAVFMMTVKNNDSHHEASPQPSDSDSSSSAHVPHQDYIHGEELGDALSTPLRTPLAPSTTQSPQPPSQQGEIYKLKPASSSKYIGASGLMPSTPVVILKKKTATRVEFDTCTIAFSIPSHSQGTPPWGVTAGHCGKPGQQVYSLPRGNNFSTAHPLGSIWFSSAADEKKNSSDWSLIRLNQKARVPSHTTKIPLMLDTYPRKQGDTLCKRGNTTGLNCGKKGKDDVRTQLRSSGKSSHPRIGVMSQAYLCALPGDSGSPLFDRHGIVGVLSSTSASSADVARGQCSQGNIAYYTPIGKVIAEIQKNFPAIEI